MRHSVGSGFTVKSLRSVRKDTVVLNLAIGWVLFFGSNGEGGAPSLSREFGIKEASSGLLYSMYKRRCVFSVAV